MTDNDLRTEQRLEPPDVAARTVLFTALSLVAFVGLSILGARFYYKWEINGPVNVAPSTFGKPRLQVDDAADLAKFEKDQHAQLDSYAWVDRGQDLIRIPIDRAMALVAAKGAGAYGPIETPAGALKDGAASKP
ncbi:MAG TPA: hypothetical protein VN688_12850 [Gemmataceae bacterium]|nr:hypothetical protein [Gemmataceae bacterium]